MLQRKVFLMLLFRMRKHSHIKQIPTKWKRLISSLKGVAIYRRKWTQTMIESPRKAKTLLRRRDRYEWQMAKSKKNAQTSINKQHVLFGRVSHWPMQSHILHAVNSWDPSSELQTYYLTHIESHLPSTFPTLISYLIIQCFKVLLELLSV